MSRNGRYSQNQNHQHRPDQQTYPVKPQKVKKRSGAVTVLSIIAAVLVLIVAGLIGLLVYNTTMERAAAARAQELAEYAAAMALTTEKPAAAETEPAETVLMETAATEETQQTTEAADETEATTAAAETQETTAPSA